MAALPKTTPSRVLASPVVERMVKVVPMLVDDNACLDQDGLDPGLVICQSILCRHVTV